MATISIPKVAADFETVLNSSVDVGDTTATLASNIDADGVALADGIYAFTIDNDTPYKEYIVCSKVGTALSAITSLSVQNVATTGFSTYHRRGASVGITDWSVLAGISGVLNTADSFDPSIHLGYSSAPVGLSGNDFATVAYVLSVATGGTVSFDQQILSSQTSGEALTANNLVYFKTSDQRWWKVDADDSSTLLGVRLGIAMSTVGAAASVSIGISGAFAQVGLTAGAKYYASQTAGAITATIPTLPAYELFVGFALSTTRLLLSNTATVDQFSGSVGTPGSTNKFVTQLATSAGATDQSQGTQSSTIALGEANATTRRNKGAQSFIPAKTSLKSVSLYKSANTGTFTGTVSIAIQADTAGSPSGVDLTSKTIPNALYNAYAVGEFLAIMSTELTVTPGNLYWIVISTSTADTANCINLGTNSAGGYASGTTKYNNTTDGWVLVPTIDLYFKVNEGFAGKDIVGSAAGFVPPQASVIKTKAGLATLGATTTTTTITHSFGKIPALIKASVSDATTGQITLSQGLYDVAAGTYAASHTYYNEATSGAYNTATDRLLYGGATTNSGFTGAYTVTGVDENVLVISGSGTANGNTIVYDIIG